MKTDVIIVGAELDGLVAAARLVEHGRTVRLFSAGAGSLHYSPAGVRLLGYSPAQDDRPVERPLEAVPHLEARHPYRLLEIDRVNAAMAWFIDAAAQGGHAYRANGRNAMAVTPAGLGLPTYATLAQQATFEDLEGKKAAIVDFANYREFPAHLMAAGLAGAGHRVEVVNHETPGRFTENAALAKSFDTLCDPRGYFGKLRRSIADDVEIVLFPAVLGLTEHAKVVAVAEDAMGVRCLEVATLPPSIPGLRLAHALERRLAPRRSFLHVGATVTASQFEDRRCTQVRDQGGRAFDASAIILSTGGTLMGGLEVDSHGTVREPVLGLDIFQTAPLDAASPDISLAALHEAGAETDLSLRPSIAGEVCENIFVTGRTLAHWNPAQECSAEGVCIATGWTAAEMAHDYLGS